MNIITIWVNEIYFHLLTQNCLFQLFYLHRLTIDCYDNNTSKENIIMLFRKCLDYITSTCKYYFPIFSPLVPESVGTNIDIKKNVEAHCMKYLHESKSVYKNIKSFAQQRQKHQQPIIWFKPKCLLSINWMSLHFQSIFLDCIFCFQFLIRTFCIHLVFASSHLYQPQGVDQDREGK